MRRLSSFRTWSGLVLFAYLALGPAGPLVLLHDEGTSHDPDCLWSAPFASETPSLTPPDPDSAPFSHCAICHSLASFRGFTAARSAGVAAPAAASPVAVDAPAFVAQAGLRASGARAPPAPRS